MPRKRRTTSPRRKSTAVARRPVRRRRVRRATRRVGGVARRAARRGVTLAKQVAIDNKHTLFAAGTGVLLGALEDRVGLWKLPLADKISPAGVLALGLFGASFIFKKGPLGQIVRHMTTGCATTAAYIMSKKYLGPDDKKMLGATEYVDVEDLDLTY